MNKPWIVGSFVLAGLALFATGLFMIGNRHEAFARHAEFYVEFSNLSGIAKGAKVQVAGIDAGEVVDVRIPASPAAKFGVKLRINETLHGLVRTDGFYSTRLSLNTAQPSFKTHLLSRDIPMRRMLRSDSQRHAHTQFSYATMFRIISSSIRLPSGRLRWRTGRPPASIAATGTASRSSS